jgi:hypothetical protein
MRKLLVFLFLFQYLWVNAQSNKITIISTSANSNLLFINCRNDLDILIPGMKKEDKLKYEVKGGKFIQGIAASKITIVPNDSTVELTIFKNNSQYYIGKFKVIKLKIPELQVFINDTLYNYYKTIYANSINTIKIKANVDEWTRSLLPNETNYKVSEFKLTLARGKRAILQYSLINDSIDIKNNRGQSGDRYILEIKKITRTNSFGEAEIISLENSVFFHIPLN